MQRINIIGIDMVLLDEESGDFEFMATVDNEFIKHFNIDEEILRQGICNFIDNAIVEKEEE